MDGYEGNFLIVTGILFFVWAFFHVLFYRISVKYIERELVKNGFELPGWDKSYSGRSIMYNQLILFKIKKHPYVDSEAVLRITRKKDWWLGFFSFFSFLLCVTVGLAWYILYAS